MSERYDSVWTFCSGSGPRMTRNLELDAKTWSTPLSSFTDTTRGKGAYTDDQGRGGGGKRTRGFRRHNSAIRESTLTSPYHSRKQTKIPSFYQIYHISVSLALSSVKPGSHAVAYTHIPILYPGLYQYQTTALASIGLGFLCWSCVGRLLHNSIEI